MEMVTRPKFCLFWLHSSLQCLFCVCPCSLRWRWSLQAWWTEACSPRATATSATPSSYLSPSAPLTMRWVRQEAPNPGKASRRPVQRADPRCPHFCISLICTNLCGVLIHYTWSHSGMVILGTCTNKHTHAFYLMYLSAGSLWVF